MSESIQLGMRPEGQEGVKASFLSLEEHAKKITMRFKETEAAAKKVPPEVDKLKPPLDDAEKKTNRLGDAFKGMGKTISAIATGGALTAIIKQIDQLQASIDKASASAAKGLVGTAFSTGDLGNLGQFRQGLMSLESPLTPEQRVGVLGAVRGTAPFADPASVMRVTRRVARTGAMAGADPDKLGALSGQFLARGFSPDQSTDLASRVLQMGGDQSLTTHAFGIADRVGASRGLSSQAATIEGLAMVMAGQRQGLKPPDGQNLDPFMSQVNPGLAGQIRSGLMSSGGALGQQFQLAMSDPIYATDIQRQVAESGVLAAGAMGPVSTRAVAMTQIQQATMREAQMGSQTGRIMRGMSSADIPFVGQFLGDHRPFAAWEQVAAQQQENERRMHAAGRASINVNVRSDDPAVSVMGSSD